jgi:hypothetical protein
MEDGVVSQSAFPRESLEPVFCRALTQQNVTFWYAQSPANVAKFVGRLRQRS